MKKCPYCGAEYPDDAVECPIDHTPLDTPGEQLPSPGQTRPEYIFAQLSEADKQKDWVTLVTCPTLLAADLIVSRLRGAGIETFLPDETLMQLVAWNLNTYGYVRVQVAPKDYDAARELLAANDPAA